VHRPSPELRQPIVQHADVLHLRRVGRRLDGWNLLIHRDSDVAAARRIDAQLHRLAVQISGLRFPALPFTLIHRHLDRVTVRPMERLVAVDERLHPVIAGGNVLHAAHRPSHDRFVDDDVGAGLHRVDVDAEDRPRAVGAVLIALRARLGLPIVGNEQEDPAVERLGAA